MAESRRGESRPPETHAVQRRKIIGQAIIDGILTPREIALIDLASDYNQSTGDYYQRGGGNYNQGGGNYNSAPLQIASFEEQATKIIRE